MTDRHGWRRLAATTAALAALIAGVGLHSVAVADEHATSSSRKAAAERADAEKPAKDKSKKKDKGGE